MKLISIKIPPDLDRKVRDVARRRRVPISVIARESLVEYVAKETSPAPGSFVEAAGELVGRLEAATERSSEPGALAGYGEPPRRRRRRK